MAIAEIGMKETGFAFRTSVEVTAAELTAAGFVSGNLICSVLYLERTGKVISQSLTGGELAGEQKTNGSVRQAAFYTFWNGTSPQKLIWEGNESSGSNLTLQAFSGVETTTPVDATAVWGTFAATASPVAPTITTVTNGAWQGCYAAATSAAVLKETTTGFTKYGNFLLGRERPTLGATGTTTMVLNESASGITLTFALRPAAEAPSNPTLSMVI